LPGQPPDGCARRRGNCHTARHYPKYPGSQEDVLNVAGKDLTCHTLYSATLPFEHGRQALGLFQDF